MLSSGPAKKVIVDVGEDQTYHGHPAYSAVLEYLFHRGVSGASVVRGVAGFGADHRLHTVAIERLTEDLPIQIQFVESMEKVEEVLPMIHEMVGTGLIEIQDTFVAKPLQSPMTLGVKEFQGPLKRESHARALRISINEHDLWKGRPLCDALVECMRANEIAGVTVFQGVFGSDENGTKHRDQLFRDSRNHPITLSVIDDEEKLRAFLPLLDEMMQEGLVALSDVEAIKYTHDFRSLERRRKSRQ